METQIATHFRIFAEAPTNRQQERHQRRQRRRLFTRTPRLHMSNMMIQIAKTFVILKIIVWTPGIMSPTRRDNAISYLRLSRFGKQK